MKVRNSFVSNSSSTSFLCDTELSADEVKAIIQRLLDVQNDVDGTDLSASYILDIWKVEDKIKIMEEYDNAIPFFVKEFIQWNLNGRVIYIEQEEKL